MGNLARKIQNTDVNVDGHKKILIDKRDNLLKMNVEPNLTTSTVNSSDSGCPTETMDSSSISSGVEKESAVPYLEKNRKYSNELEYVLSNLGSYLKCVKIGENNGSELESESDDFDSKSLLELELDGEKIKI